MGHISLYKYYLHILAAKACKSKTIFQITNHKHEHQKITTRVEEKQGRGRRRGCEVVTVSICVKRHSLVNIQQTNMPFVKDLSIGYLMLHTQLGSCPLLLLSRLMQQRRSSALGRSRASAGARGVEREVVSTHVVCDFFVMQECKNCKTCMVCQIKHKLVHREHATLHPTPPPPPPCHWTWRSGS